MVHNGVIRVLLADDHTIVRQGLAKLLEDEPGIEVAGEAEDGRDAVRKTETMQPDVVIMDIAMPLLNGVEATKQIKKSSPETKIVILSMHSNDRFISELLGAGASGYLLKDSSGSEIVQAIHAAMKGHTYLSPSISRRVVHDYISLKKEKPPREGLYGKLSNREREVFQMLAEGRTSREIAGILCVSTSTVKTHRANIMEKLKIDNAAQLIQFAIELGLVQIGS